MLDCQSPEPRGSRSCREPLSERSGSRWPQVSGAHPQLLQPRSAKPAAEALPERRARFGIDRAQGDVERGEPAARGALDSCSRSRCHCCSRCCSRAGAGAGASAGSSAAGEDGGKDPTGAFRPSTQRVRVPAADVEGAQGAIGAERGGERGGGAEAAEAGGGEVQLGDGVVGAEGSEELDSPAVLPRNARQGATQPAKG